MNDTRDPNVIIGAWLDEGPTDLPESTRRAITTSVRTIDQRRGFTLPWTNRPVTSWFGPALVAAAVVVAVAGIYMLAPFGRTPSVGPPVGSPTASEEPPATPPPAAVGRIAFTRYDADIGPFGENLGTFIVNLVGCVVFGAIAGAAQHRFALTPEARAFLLVGVLGGFTTFSSYVFESVALLRDGQFFAAAVNIAGQVVAGFAGLWSAYLLMR